MAESKKSMNYNVKLALWWSLFENASASVRSGDIFSGFIYLISGSNSTVGYIQGINGCMQLFAAVPAGLLTDRCRRDTVLRIAAGIGLVAGLTLAYCLFFSAPVWAFMIAMGLVGSYKGFNNPAIESIFADSVQRGKSKLFTLKYAVTSVASCFGPCLSVIMFLFLGDQWRAPDCRIVLLVGLSLMVVPVVVMCCFNDDKSLGESSEAKRPAKRVQSEAELREAQWAQEENKGCCGAACPPTVLIPALILFSDLIGSLASGMTIKFFGLFFYERCGLSPVAVSLLATVAPFLVSGASFAAQWGSKWIGRVGVSILTRAMDIVLLIVLAYLPPQGGTWALTALIASHLLRKAVANCTRPLLRSVLMDHVPKRHRGKVNALDSVRTFSWSGSAALGGLLIERLDFQQTFIITAAIKAVSFAPLLVLLVMLEEGTCCFACLPGWKRRHLEQSVLDAGDPEANLALAAPLIAEADREDDQPPVRGMHATNGEAISDMMAHTNGR